MDENQTPARMMLQDTVDGVSASAGLGDNAALCMAAASAHVVLLPLQLLLLLCPFCYRHTVYAPTFSV
jgi:hypothetical protein